MPLPADLIDEVIRNLKRVEHLVVLYEEKVGAGRGRKDVPVSDILRAATVFLHATLEDFLRRLASRSLPTAPAEVLDKVPLVGLEGRAEKFFLGALVAHRNKSVEQVLQASIEAHLNRANYNDPDEIASLLRSLGIDPARVNGRFGDLREMMERRHLIVHQADRNAAAGPGQHSAKSIGRKKVKLWIDAVTTFVASVADESK